MHKSRIVFVIVFTSIALVGLIATQAFWVTKAISLVDDQHGHRIDMALNEVINRMVDANDTSLVKLWDPDYTVPSKDEFFEVVDTLLLTSLLKQYTDYHQLDTMNYEFAIVKNSTDSVIYASATDIPRSLKRNTHNVCLSSLWKADLFHLELYTPSPRKEVLVDMSMWLIFSGIFIMIVIFAFLYIIHTIIRQKKISEIKNDFINNMTHEFKTPISTISLASEVLLQSNSASSLERIRKYAKVIYDENIRMRGQVESVLQVARLDKREFNLKKSEFNLHSLIEETMQNLCFNQSEDQVSVNYHLEAEKSDLYADEMHIKNIVANLVDNAIKYSSNGIFINVFTRNRDRGIVLSIEDRGIGMNTEAIRHIFDKFYRVPTGNLHNVKGFGLGLYYVKNMVTAHGGQIHVQSEPNQGSRFDIYLPLDTPG